MSTDLVHAVDELSDALDVLEIVSLALSASPGEEEIASIRSALYKDAIVRVRNAKTFLGVAMKVPA